MELRLNCESCQILWMGALDTTRRSDYVSVHLGYSGYLTVEVDLGGGVASKTIYDISLNDNQWHLIRIHRYVNITYHVTLW